MNKSSGISYAKLQELLIGRKIKKSRRKEDARISPGTYAKLNKDELVSMEILIRICSVLHCDVGDICASVSDEEED